MKYKSNPIKYNINIEYASQPRITTGKYKYDKKSWDIISIIRHNYLALNNCKYCIRQINIIDYDNIYEDFILTSIWINGIISKYNISDCFIISNRLYFIESLLYYDIKTIGYMPIYDHHTEQQINDYIYKFNTIYPNTKLIIENKNSISKYNNIILLFNGNISNNKEFKWNNHTYYEVIRYIGIALKFLQKGGNLIFRISYNTMDAYNSQLIYLLSCMFEQTIYKKKSYTQNYWTKQLIIFRKFKSNNNIFDNILEKLSDNQKQITNLVDVKFDSKYNKFMRYINKNINYINKINKLYDKKQFLINNISDDDLEKLQKKYFMQNIDKCIYLAQKANLPVKKKYIMKNYKYKNEIVNNILKDPITLYYKLTNYYSYTS